MNLVSFCVIDMYYKWDIDRKILLPARNFEYEINICNIFSLSIIIMNR